MSNTIPNNDQALVLDQKNIDGVNQYFAKTPNLVLAGKPTTPGALEAIFQGDIDAHKALEAVEADLKEKRAAAKAARAAALQARADIKAYILGNFGAQAVAMLTAFGFPPPKPKGARTVAAKAKAVAQSKATRTMRGTKGKRQKAAIKAPLVAPPAPPAPAPGSTTPAK
jgi:hypothetical protein